MKQSEWKNEVREFSRWRWFAGGSVLGVAVLLGCASALQFRGAEEEKTVAHKRSLATAYFDDGGMSYEHGATSGGSHQHNDGKVRLPVAVSFEGDQVLTTKRDLNVIIWVTASADITRLQGYIEGSDGLKGFGPEMLNFTKLDAGEIQRVALTVPAKTGGLVVRLVGDVGDSTLSTALELKVVNPDDGDVRANSTNEDVGRQPVRDATGQVVRPMRSKSRENK
ncbi:MAG: hypothetical protein RBT63_03135 [Bdellovibrionales bacterium]|jgi:hypothetical protein|nr:hypothetical protein [Bdellovibrionales bacterium]